MAKKNQNNKKEFERWRSIFPHTWSFQLYKKYNSELNCILWSELITHKFVYNQLGKEQALWTDKTNKYFSVPQKVWNFPTLQEWATSYNDAQNWILLNCIVALNANLETYLDSVISLAIESNPGLLLHADKYIDGTLLLKNSSFSKEDYSPLVMECTKGTWSQRVSAFKKLFGEVPITLAQSISSLDKARITRNNAAHALGRDIEQSRKFISNEKLSAEAVSLDRLKKLLGLFYKIVEEVDTYLLEKHIGAFQIIIHLHNNYDQLTYKTIQGRSNAFKRMYSSIDNPLSKQYSLELLQYYESL